MQRVAPSPAIQACCIVAYSFSFLVFGMQINLLGPTASVVAERVGVVEPDLGIIFTVNGLMSILGGLPSGWLIDRLPGHAVLAVALAFEALGYVFIPYARSLLSLAVAFGSVALSWNIINTAGNTYILWLGNAHEKPEAQGVLINMVNALFGAGSLAAPLVAELCATRLGNAMSAYWITAALTALSAVSFLVLSSPHPPSSSSASSAAASLPAGASEREEGGDGSEALQQPLLLGETGSAGAAEDMEAQQQQQQQQQCNGHAAAEAGRAATGSDDKPWPVSAAAAASGPGSSNEDISSSSSSSSWSHWWRGGPLTGLLLIICLFNFLNVGTEVAFGAWIFSYSLKQAGLSVRDAHLLNASYWGAFTLGRIIASFGAALLQPATLLFASLPLALLGAVIALLLPAGSLAGAGVWLLLLVSVLIGLGVSAGFANSLALLDNYHPCTGSVTGLLGGVAGAGCMTIPLLIGGLAKYSVIGYQGLMAVCALSFLLQLLCVPAALAVGRVWAEREGGQVRDAESITQYVIMAAPEDGTAQRRQQQ